MNEKFHVRLGIILFCSILKNQFLWTLRPNGCNRLPAVEATVAQKLHRASPRKRAVFVFGRLLVTFSAKSNKEKNSLIAHISLDGIVNMLKRTSTAL